MKYLNKTFQGPNPSSTDGITCEACVYGDRWAKHSPECPKYTVLFPDTVPLNDHDKELMKGANEWQRGQLGPNLVPGQSIEEFCDLYQIFS